MSEKNIVKYSIMDIPRGRSNLERLRNKTDEEIAAAVAQDPDAAPIDLDWSDAEVIYPPKKRAISIRLDEDVIEFFKQSGPGYQTRMNAVLRHYMKHQTGKE